MYSLFRQSKFLLAAYMFLLILGLTLTILFGKDNIHIFINKLHSTQADLFFKYITHLGDGLFALGILTVLLFFSFRASLIQLIAFVSSGLLAQVLKRFFFSGIPRPVKFFEGIYDLHIVEGVEIAKYNSFPSGHTATAFALFFCMILLTRNKLQQILFFSLALLVGYSRMYLSQHFLPDVLMGSVLGTITAYVSVYFVNTSKAQWLNDSLTTKLKKVEAHT